MSQVSVVNSARSIRQIVLAIAFGSICAVASLYHWSVGPALLLAACVAVAAISQPMATWRVAVVVILLGTSYARPPFGSLLAWGILTVFLFGAWMERFAEGLAWQWGSRGLWLAILLWFGWIVAATYHSLYPPESAKEIERLGLSFVTLLIYLNWVTTGRQLRQMIRWWEAVAVVIAGMGLLETAAQRFGLSWFHLIGPYPSNLDQLGPSFATLIPLSVALRLRGTVAARPASFLAVAILAGGVWATASRASCLAALVGSLVVLWHARPAWRRTITLSLVGLAIMGLLAAQLKYHSLSTAVHHHLSGRDRVWTAALKATGEAPWLGIGPGCWAGWFGRHYVSADFLLEDLKGNTFVLAPTLLGGEAHSLFLTKAAEGGWPSMLGLLAILAAWFVGVRSAWRQIPRGAPQALVVGSWATMSGLVVLGLFEDGPIIGKARGQEILLVWLVAALPFLVARMARQTGQDVGRA